MGQKKAPQGVKPSRFAGKYERRARDKDRMKARAARAFPFLSREAAAKQADHIKVCSCPCCGNPRRHWRQKGMAERRADEAWRVDISDLS